MKTSVAYVWARMKKHPKFNIVLYCWDTLINIVIFLKDSKKCCLYPKTRYHSDPMIIQIYLFPTIFFYNSTILILVPNCLILKLRDIVKMPPSEYQKLNGGRKEDAKILMSISTPVDFLYEFEFTY